MLAEPLENITISDGQNVTGNNDKFVRFFWEVDGNDIGTKRKWFFYAKGGGFRKWSGNLDCLVDWSEEARKHYRTDRICRIIPEYLWYKKGITWGLIASSLPSFRILPEDATFDKGGSSIFFKNEKDINLVLGFLNSKLAVFFLKMFNPTLNYQVRDIRNLPMIESSSSDKICQIAKLAIAISTHDWDNFETSWKYQSFPLLTPPIKDSTVDQSWENWRTDCTSQIERMQQLETENNRLFIEAYGLQDELSPEVLEDQITLAHADREADMKRLISYAVGCMMGRYSLDQPGLIYAHSGNVGFDRSKYVALPADDDGIIPVFDIDWFPRDAANRFEEFLKVAWSPEALAGNLKFIADSLSPKSWRDTS